MACVYALSSSLDPGVVRYVGRSKFDTADSRLKDHLKQARNGCLSHKYNWIRSVEAAGGEIVATVLESGLSWSESGVREVSLIAHHRSLRADLTNGTDGGDGSLGRSHSPETREKMSITRKGKPMPPFSVEHRSNLSAAGKGRTCSTESREKMSAAHKGKPLSASHCAAMSVAHKGKQKSDEHQAKITASLTGKTRSPEQRANMSAAQKGKPKSPKARANMSAARSGKP